MKKLLTYINEAEGSKIIDAMKNALKEELNAWYGYVIVKEWLTGTDRKDIEKFYEDTAKDELEDHGYWLMKRINQLGGTIEDITMSPNSWETATHKYIAPTWTKDNIDIKKSPCVTVINALSIYLSNLFIKGIIFNNILNCSSLLNTTNNI